MSRKVVVTGASSEIGAAVVREFESNGYDVRAMVRSSSKRDQLEGTKSPIIVGDVTDRESLLRAFDGVDAVINIAALYRDPTATKDDFFKVNHQGVLNVFQTAIKVGVSQIIHCSTGGVLGDVTDPPGTDKTPYSPGDEYQDSKVEGEKAALEFYRSGKIGGVVIRPAMVFGPGDTRYLKLFRLIKSGRFFYIGAGKKWVHFVDVRDLARSFRLALEHPERNGEIYHIGGRLHMHLFEAVNIMADELGVSRPKIKIPLWPVQLAGSLCEAICMPLGITPPIYRRRVDFFAKSRWFDISKAIRELEYQPLKDFREEVRDTIEYYRSKGLLS